MRTQNLSATGLGLSQSLDSIPYSEMACWVDRNIPLEERPSTERWISSLDDCYVKFMSNRYKTVSRAAPKRRRR